MKINLGIGKCDLLNRPYTNVNADPAKPPLRSRIR